ncbi:MAG TPA: hypothetical protein VJ978_00565 [Nitriliruptoraceae bacterium]|nr:hypothetical protein [Nitriliruptoraceae bacterium]
MATAGRSRERDPNFPSWHRPSGINPRVVWRDVAVIVVVATIVVIAGSVRFTPNEALPPAQELTGSMDAVYRDVRSNDLQLPQDDTMVAPNVLGARVGDGRWSLAGQVDDDCYAMWWDDSGLRRVRLVPVTVACTPANGADDSRLTIAAVAPAAPESAATANWDSLWPDATRVKAWWLPLLFVAGALILSAGVRIVVMLVTGRSVRGMK